MVHVLLLNIEPLTVCFHFIKVNWNILVAYKCLVCLFFSVLSYMQVNGGSTRRSRPEIVTSGLKKTRWERPNFQTRDFKKAVHKPMGDVTDGTLIIFTVYGSCLSSLIVTLNGTVGICTISTKFYIGLKLSPFII